MNRDPRHSNPKIPRAFTLIELLVVIALIALMLTLTLPLVSAMTKSSRGDAAMNSISVASAAARAFATRTKPSAADPPYNIINASYSGVAILFAPSGELRLVENNQFAVATNGATLPLESRTPALNGYSDLPGREFVTMPKRAGVVGIARVGGNHILLPPPFAIRFNELGQLVVGSDIANDGYRVVFYDGNLDGKFETNTGATAYSRSNGYLPDEWDPDSTSYVDSYDSAAKKHKLPFEAIEAVVGIIAYSKDEFRARFPGQAMPYRFDNVTNANVTAMYEWLLEADPSRPGKLKNGNQIFFSRYSGAVMREQ